MDVKVEYKVTGSKKGLFERVRPQIMGQIKSLVNAEVEAYLDDLKKHMGPIPGDKAYQRGAISWSPLDPDTIEDSPRFWYETGKARQSIVVNVKTTDNGIKAFVGIPEGSDAYNEVLWNELGFTPKNGDKLIRRPLFIPLAQEHMNGLKEKLRERLGSLNIQVRI